jgi:S-adenosylmethionine synthetase
MHNNDSLMGVGGDVRNAFGGSSTVSIGELLCCG